MSAPRPLRTFAEEHRQRRRANYPIPAGASWWQRFRLWLGHADDDTVTGPGTEGP